MAQDPVPVASTPQPRYSVTTAPAGTAVTSSTATPGSTGRWEGDWWVDGDYRAEKRWVERYPHLYGPLATDPDCGLGDIELDDNLAKAMRKIDGYGGIGSTSGERHCAGTAAYIAWNFVESSADIPPVPKFWVAEAHYWFMTITAIRLAKKNSLAKAACYALSTLPALLSNKKVIGAITAALAAGGIIIPPLAQEILKLAGIA